MSSQASRNKAIVALVGAFFICFLILFATSARGCNSTADDPTAAVKGAVAALPSRNASQVAAYFTGQAHEDMLEGLAIFYAEYETVAVSNIGVNLESKGPTIATVFVAYDLTVSAYGNSNTQHFQHKVQVVKLNGRWYLNGKI